MKKSLSDVTYLANEKNENKHKETKEQTGDNTPTPGSSSRRPNGMLLPGIFVSNFDPSDVDECDGESPYYDEEPRERAMSYDAGGARCTLTVRGAGRGSSYSSSAGLFTSQRSLPWSSRCSSRLGVGDSGWDGDVSHNGSTSTVSHRDWTGGPCSDAVQRPVLTSASMNLRVPFDLDRRHSMSTAEQKLANTSAARFGDQQESAAQREDGRTIRFLPTKTDTTGRLTSDDDEAQRQSLRVGRSQVPDVHRGISSSRSLTEIETATVEVTVDDEDSDKTSVRRSQSMTTAIKRRPLRPKKAVNNRRADMTTIWINRHHHHHQQQQHTDDSEVERRVERLLYEIDHSVTESVDESKIQSQEFEMPSD